MAKENATISLEEGLWYKVKIKCLKEKIKLSEYIEELIKKDLEKR